jgi:hypothetical protein
MMMIDVARERADSLNRRAEEEHRRKVYGRARRILERRWDATEDDLREAAIREMPWLAEPKWKEDLDELLSAAAKLQVTDRPRIDPRTLTPRAPLPQLKPTRPRQRAPAQKREDRPMIPSESAAPAKRKLNPVDLRRISKADRQILNEMVEREAAGEQSRPIAAIVEAIQTAAAKELGWDLEESQAIYLAKKPGHYPPARQAMKTAPRRPALPIDRARPSAQSEPTAGAATESTTGDPASPEQETSSTAMPLQFSTSRQDGQIQVRLIVDLDPSTAWRLVGAIGDVLAQEVARA